ncbi:putative short chain dehydrogenase/oxidoreductase, partial [Aureobasidium melanogenum]|uniref:Putative short chain dehydrogenase/oxidoreductase n=1 Tax=Aureobasidium melanogenum (strain CBS 110374) TaxID=1043003 RepID=A0A074WCS3_AURM1
MHGKTALVTGGCGGLGLAISDALLTAGCNVVVCDINPSTLQKFRDSHSSSNKILALHCDISKQSQVTKLFEDSIQQFGKVDFVVNNAGIMDKMDPVGTLDMQLYEKVIAVNLTAPIMISKVAVQHMMDKNIAGCIINIASIGGIRGFAAGVAYTASKHAVVGLTKNTAVFYGSKGIRCNAVLPGGMETNIGTAFAAGYNQEGMAVVKDKAMATAQGPSPLKNVAAAVAFLCSHAAASINGVCLPVDQGWTAL